MKDRAVPPGPGRSKGRGIVAGLLLLGVSCVLGVLLLEWAVRISFPFFSPKTQIPFQLNADGVPLGPPGQAVRQATPKGDYDTIVHFNSYGLRDSKDLRNAHANDWFALGDSFTMGWGVDEEQRYSNRLEQMFQTNGYPALVYNIAIPENILGYARLLKYAQSKGAKVGRLILGVCMENDLRDYRDGRCDWDPADGKSPGAAISTKEALRTWLRRHSALYTAISFTVQKSAACRGVLERLGIARDVEHLSGQNSGDAAVLTSSRDALVKLVTGYEALVLIIPSRRLWHGSTMATEQRVHEQFVGLLREAGLAVVDPKPALEKTGKPLAYYFATDPHWNAQGQAIAAEELYQVIASRVRSSAAAAPQNLLAQPKPTP